MTTLYVCKGSKFREATDEEIIAQAQAIISRHFRPGVKPLSEPKLTEAFLRVHLGGLDHEVFGVLHLDSHHRLIAAENLFRGTVDVSAVYPREVVRSVVAHGSAKVIFYHNHPSGVPEPSRADRIITERLKQALALIDVSVLDHVIVAESVYSFNAAGLL